MRLQEPFRSEVSLKRSLNSLCEHKARRRVCIRSVSSSFQRRHIHNGYRNHRGCLGDFSLFLSASVLLLWVAPCAVVVEWADAGVLAGLDLAGFTQGVFVQLHHRRGERCPWVPALAVLAVIQPAHAAALSLAGVGTAPSVSVLRAANSGQGAEPCFLSLVASLLPSKGESTTCALLCWKPRWQQTNAARELLTWSTEIAKISND